MSAGGMRGATQNNLRSTQQTSALAEDPIRLRVGKSLCGGR